uniref:shugoshin 1 n=1 Tax=Myxine glutinosa TaxID=7769 RepID=UPI00358E8801
MARDRDEPDGRQTITPCQITKKLYRDVADNMKKCIAKKNGVWPAKASVNLSQTMATKSKVKARNMSLLKQSLLANNKALARALVVAKEEKSKFNDERCELIKNGFVLSQRLSISQERLHSAESMVSKMKEYLENIMNALGDITIHSVVPALHVCLAIPLIHDSTEMHVEEQPMMVPNRSRCSMQQEKTIVQGERPDREPIFNNNPEPPLENTLTSNVQIPPENGSSSKDVSHVQATVVPNWDLNVTCRRQNSPRSFRTTLPWLEDKEDHKTQVTMSDVADMDMSSNVKVAQVGLQQGVDSATTSISCNFEKRGQELNNCKEVDSGASNCSVAAGDKAGSAQDCSSEIEPEEVSSIVVRKVRSSERGSKLKPAHKITVVGQSSEAERKMRRQTVGHVSHAKRCVTKALMEDGHAEEMHIEEVSPLITITGAQESILPIVHGQQSQSPGEIFRFEFTEKPLYQNEENRQVSQPKVRRKASHRVKCDKENVEVKTKVRLHEKVVTSEEIEMPRDLQPEQSPENEIEAWKRSRKCTTPKTKQVRMSNLSPQKVFNFELGENLHQSPYFTSADMDDKTQSCPTARGDRCSVRSDTITPTDGPRKGQNEEVLPPTHGTSPHCFPLRNATQCKTPSKDSIGSPLLEVSNLGKVSFNSASPSYQLALSLQYNPQTSPRRLRQKGSLRYTEPRLNEKLRRGDKFTSLTYLYSPVYKREKKLKRGSKEKQGKEARNS